VFGPPGKYNYLPESARKQAEQDDYMRLREASGTSASARPVVGLPGKYNYLPESARKQAEQDDYMRLREASGKSASARPVVGLPGKYNYLPESARKQAEHDDFMRDAVEVAAQNAQLAAIVADEAQNAAVTPKEKQNALGAQAHSNKAADHAEKAIEARGPRKSQTQCPQIWRSCTERSGGQRKGRYGSRPSRFG
jgi:hypothetical protein